MPSAKAKAALEQEGLSSDGAADVVKKKKR